jgi:sugar phosphate permease
VVCVAGTVIAAAIYFTAAFSALGWLSDATAYRIGDAVGSTTTALGFPAGVAVFGLLFWDRLVDSDGKPDWLARVVVLVIGAPLVVGPLFLAGMMALDAVARFKALGFLAVVGFLGIVGLLERWSQKRA